MIDQERQTRPRSSGVTIALGLVTVIGVAAALTRSSPPPDLSRYRAVEPRHGEVHPGVEQDERLGFLASFLDARAEGEGAEQYLSIEGRAKYESFGDERSSMESRALYALWRYEVLQRKELADGGTEFWVKEEGHERESNKLNGYIEESFIVMPTGAGLEIDVSDIFGMTAF